MSDVTEEEISKKFGIHPDRAQKIYRAYQIFKETPEEHQTLHESSSSFEEWYINRLISFDYSYSRVRKVRELLGSGLKPKEVREILQKVDGIRAEEASVLDMADKLADDIVYTWDEIRSAMYSFAFDTSGWGKKLEQAIHGYYKDNEYYQGNKEWRLRVKKDQEKLDDDTL